MLPTVEALISSLRQLSECRRLKVALSGGLDSMVLLHLAVRAGQTLGIPVSAIHVHHGLDPAADAWQAHCERFCLAWSVPLTVCSVRVAAGASLEGQARAARYQAFEAEVSPGDYLLLAHHADDQAETLLLRLLRGTGLRGLGGIPQSRTLGQGDLWRPLLAYSRADLKAYAESEGLSWVEDPSNSALDLDRSYLRQKLMPGFAKRWPGYAGRWAQAMAHCREGEALLEDLARVDAERCLRQGLLAQQELQKLPQRRQRNLLRHWLRWCDLPIPDAVHLARIINELLPAAEDATPQVAWQGGEVRRYRGKLYALNPDAVRRLQANAQLKGVRWDLTESLHLPGGRLSARRVDRGGVQIPVGASLEVRFRQGGERCRPQGRQGSHPLKKLWQEWGVPPWERPYWPLLYLQEELVAVPGCCVCAGFAGGSDAPGWLLSWEPVCRESCSADG